MDNEGYTNVILWDRDERGDIKLLAQAQIPMYKQWHPKPFWLYAPTEANVGDPQTYVEELANHLAFGSEYDPTTGTYGVPKWVQKYGATRQPNS